MKKFVVIACIVVSLALTACGGAPAPVAGSNTSSMSVAGSNSSPSTDLRQAQGDGGEWISITATVQEADGMYTIHVRVEFTPLENSSYVANNATLVRFEYNGVEASLAHAEETDLGPFPNSVDEITFRLISVQNTTLGLSWSCTKAVEYLHWTNPVYNCHQ